MALISLLFILVGFGYKVSMVPFHYWTPDVYEGSPITITAFLSVAPKAAGFALFLRTFFVLFTDAGTFLSETFILDVDWPVILACLAAATMTIGNLLAMWLLDDYCSPDNSGLRLSCTILSIYKIRKC